MELEDGVLVLKRIRVRYVLRVTPAQTETARRVHEVHHHGCPVYRSISGCVAITTELAVHALEGE